MKKVSVIVPVYNGILHIQECLDSLVKQTLDDMEIIVIDDGSNDGTELFLDNYATAHDGITVVHQTNQGLYSSRKKGLELACGEYVGWVDADDFAAPEMFATLYETAIKNDSDLVYCDYNFYPAKVKTKCKWFRPYMGKRDSRYVEHNSQPWNKLVRLSFARNIGLGDLIVSCFDEAYIKVLIEAHNPISINDKLYFYRVGLQTMSTSYTDVNHYERFVEANRQLELSMQSDNKYWNDYFRYRVTYYMLMTMLVAAHAGNKDKYRFWKNELRKEDRYYKKNQHYKAVLMNNIGFCRYVAVSCIEFSYFTTRILSKIALG